MNSCKGGDGEHWAVGHDGQHKVSILCTKKDKNNSNVQFSIDSTEIGHYVNCTNNAQYLSATRKLFVYEDVHLHVLKTHVLW